MRFDGLPGPKGIAIFYPHTSNWDFVLGLLAKWSLGVQLRWIGKESLFRGLTGATLGRLMRLWGGRPVDRAQASGAVEQLAQLFQSEPWFWLGLSPEGTRRRTDHLRSGFYHLALTLDLPVALAYIDYARREIGVIAFRAHEWRCRARPRRVARFLRRQGGTPPRKRRHDHLQIESGAMRRPRRACLAARRACITCIQSRCTCIGAADAYTPTAR